MPSHVNFYENIKEARMRLLHTVVLYDGVPFYIYAVSDHRPDGIFRVYMDEIGNPKGMAHQRLPAFPYDHGDSTGVLLDEYISKNPNCGIVRKMMNSPSFNKFRPFPLGMMNMNGDTFYIERQPVRHTQQGLTNQMIVTNPVSLKPSDKSKIASVVGHGSFGVEFKMMVLGQYPSFDECVKNLTDPEVINDAVGFHRDFAVVRGPVDTLFLGYKDSVVGTIPNADRSVLRLSRKHVHVKESVEELGIFKSIQVK